MRGLDALETEPENTLSRDASIQRFEFTYGPCVSLLARYLEQIAIVPLERELTFPAMIRQASENGLLRSGWDVWYSFREARNLTSHTYNESKALQVIEKLPDFLDEARFLLKELEKRTNEDAVES